MTVQRFNPVASAAISLSEQGEYVKYEDYAALADRLAETNLRNTELVAKIEPMDRRIAELEALAAMDREPVGEFYEDGPLNWYQISDGDRVPAHRRIPLYRHAQQPVVPEEMQWSQVTGRDGFKFVEGWNACRAAMLQSSNDGTNGKQLTIPLPDTGSKAFWSGTGKSEVFHPETYKRWVKEAIERSCAIAGIGVEVK